MEPHHDIGKWGVGKLKRGVATYFRICKCQEEEGTKAQRVS